MRARCANHRTCILRFELKYLLNESSFGLENLIIHQIDVFQRRFAIRNTTNQIVQWKLDSNEHKDARKIFYNADESAWIEIDENGGVDFKGDHKYGGNPPPEVRNKLTTAAVISTVVSTEGAFAVLTKEGEVLVWGNKFYGGDPSEDIKEQFKEDIDMIFSTYGAFAALTKKGKVIVWGHKNYDGNPSEEIKKQLINIKTIVSTNIGAFAALNNQGKAIVWGHESWGGNAPAEIRYNY